MCDRAILCILFGCKFLNNKSVVHHLMYDAYVCCNYIILLFFLLAFLLGQNNVCCYTVTVAVVICIRVFSISMHFKLYIFLIIYMLQNV